jgi:FAD:protein FMN transferase
MATYFEVRIADEERTYAAQAAQAALDLVDKLESRLSRFRANSDIAQIAQLAPGERMRLSEPAFACLELQRRWSWPRVARFPQQPRRCKHRPLYRSGNCCRRNSRFVRERAAAIRSGRHWQRVCAGPHGGVAANWDCNSFLLVAGGSSILAGDAPKDAAGWSCGLGDDNATQRLLLTHASLSGSGLAVKGSHILDPRTGQSALRQNRAWALTDTAAESDALSTACMVLSEPELEHVLAQDESWLVFLERDGIAEPMGRRAMPPQS